MMEQEPYLLFELNHSPYGVAASFVQEIFFLPALTDIAEAETDVAGILSLRGQLLTVIDLNRRLGKTRQPYSLNHSVIVIHWEGHKLGVIVNRVNGVELISTSEISSHFMSGAIRKTESPLLLGLAQHQDQIISLINPEALIKRRSLSAQENLLTLPFEKNGSTPELSDKTDPNSSLVGEELSVEFMAEFNSHEQDILRDRANSLRHIPDNDSSVGLLPLAVVGLQGEYFGLNLDNIHEFTEIRQITPIPCCPSHIVGNMNLRGEILTLVNINQILQLKGEIQTESSAFSHHQAVVVRLDKLVAGVTVDTVYDVVYLHPSQISPIPAAVHAMNEDFIRGVASYQEKQMSILDLSKILSSEDLVVNESA